MSLRGVKRRSNLYDEPWSEIATPPDFIGMARNDWGR
jgi:hypothetical protein